jgi:hypothetical protein
VPEIALDAEGERVLRDAQNFCFQSRVSILAPEHLLAAALLTLGENRPGLPTAEEVAGAFLMVQGMGSEETDANVMFGSAARDALNTVARNVRVAGGTAIDAHAIAVGVIGSGEVNPMFFAELGWSKDRLLAALG